MGTLRRHNFQVLQLSMWLLFPHLFKLVDLLGLDLARPLLFNIARFSHEPRKESLVLDHWHPIVGVVRALFHA